MSDVTIPIGRAREIAAYLRSPALGPYLVTAVTDHDDGEEVMRVTIPTPQEVADHLDALINHKRVDCYITLYLAERLPDD